MAPMYGIWCPRGKDCTKAGKMLAKGRSDEAVRYKLWEHLSWSPYHEGLGEKERQSICRDAETSVWDEPEDQECQGHEQQMAKKKEEDKAEQAAAEKKEKKKRRRKSRSRSPSARKRSPSRTPSAKKEPGSSSASHEGLLKVCKDMIQRELSNLPAVVAAAQSAASAAAAAAQARTPLAATANAVAATTAGSLLAIRGGLSSGSGSGSGSGSYTLGQQAMEELCDTVQRAEHAARQAARIAIAANQAFESEANSLQASVLAIRRLLGR